MDLGSANESLEETRDVHKEDGLGFVGKRSGELDLNLVASKEEGDEDFGHEKEACVMRRIDVDLNQEEPQKFPESSVEIGINLSPGSSESPLPKSRSPSPGPVNSLSTVNDKSDRGDIYQGKSPMLITERQTSDYNSWRSLSPSRDGSSPHRMGRESLDYNSDGSRSPLDIKTSRGEMGAVICDSCAGRSPSPGQIASSDYETEKGNSAPNFGKPSVAVTTDCSPEEMERENSDLCERKSVAIHDETTKEIVDNPKSLFESVHEKMEVDPNHYSEEFHYPDESKYRCVENFDQHSGKLPSPVRTVYSDDEPKEEIFYTEKSSSPENSKPYNGETEAGDSYIHSPGRTPKRSASPVRRQMSVSPYRSPYEPPSSAQKPPPSIKNIQEPSNSEARGSQPPVSDPSRSPVTKNKSPRRKRLRLRSRSPSPKRVRPQENLRPDASPYSRRRVSPVKHPSPSPGRAPARDVQRRNDSPRNHLSASPRRRNSPPGSQRRRDRSVSRSPVRRDAYSGSRRDYHERSRSRSPYSRDRYRSSSRRRCSPRRRRSPAFGCCSRYRSPRRRPWSPPPNRSTGIGKPGNNLFVAGFSFVTTERDLEKKFSRFGRVTDVRIVRDKRSGDSRGFGFLSLERDEDADAAIRALDQTEWNGRVVLVEKSKAPAH